MKCKKCGSDIDYTSFANVDESMHDEEVLEVSIICPNCNQYHYAFVELSDFQAEVKE